MNELVILFSIGSLQVTAYALCVALGTLLGVLITVWIGRKRLGVDACLSLSLAVIPLAVLGARLTYWLTNLQYIQIDLGYGLFAFLWQLWEGGFTLYGAILGGMAGAWLYAHITRRPLREIFDLIAPGAALALAVIRLGEYFTGQGLGKLVEAEPLQFFPLAVTSLWEEWAMPVFFYEAVAALIIMAVTWSLIRRGGHAAEAFIALLGVTQVLLESWRMDEFIRFGFVRFNQIASAVMMAAVLAIRIARAVKRGGWSRWSVARIVLFLLGIGMVIAIEFALDKSTIDNRLLYVIMAGTLAVMGVSLLTEERGPAPHRA